MQIDNVNMNDFIEDHKIENNLITSPMYFIGGTTPDPSGLFSTEIFGRPGSDDRKNKFGYVELNAKFVHPVYYKLLTSMNKKIQDLLLSKKYFKVENGELVEDYENGETGPSYFYSIYKQLKFNDTGTDRRSTYLDLLDKTPEEEMFVDKWLIIPPYLRDFNSSTTDPNEIKAVDEVNDMYAKLIRYSMSLDKNSSGFMNAITEANIQQLLFQIYEYFIFKLNKKTGMFHQDLLGKSVDYATRSVITAPRIAGKGYHKVPIKFGYVGIPLSQIIVLFFPFFINYIENYIEEHELELSKFVYKGKEIVINNVKEQFSEKEIKRLMNLFIKSPESRFMPLTVKDANKKEYPVNLYKKDLGRNFTLTDLFFIAAKDIVGDGPTGKHVYMTRYPIETYQNIFPNRIAILSTKKTKEQKLEDRYLPDYPVIYDDYVCDESMFIDSVRPHNSTLGSLGADYDGDTVSLRGVFTVEANLEADRLIFDKKNFFNMSGSSSREIGKEAKLAIYCLTRDPIL